MCIKTTNYISNVKFTLDFRTLKKSQEKIE